MHTTLRFLLLLAVFAAVYTRGVTYDFVWDDVHEIAANPDFDRSLWEGLGKTQTERTDPDLTGLPTIRLAYDSYRPLLFASYWAQVQVWGRDPVALHAGNLVIGWLSILLAYALLRRWLGGDAALAPTVVFALHPLQVETIVYVSARADLLAGCFALGSAYAALRWFDGGRGLRWGVVAIAAYVLSLGCKEVGIGLPIAIWMLGVLRGHARPAWKLAVAMLATTALYLALRAAMITATSDHALKSALWILPGVWLDYFRVGLLPFDLSIDRMYTASRTWVGWGCVVIALALTARYHRRIRAARPELRQMLGGVIWMLLLLAPSAVAVSSTGTVSDRYAYIALLGFAVVLSAAFSELRRLPVRLRVPVRLVGYSWCVLAFFVSWMQVAVWRSNTTLYAHAAAHSPHSSLAQYRLGYLDAQAGQWETAIAYFERAVELDPHNAIALNNLGVGQLRLRRFADAESALERAVEVAPARYRSWLNLGLAQSELGKRGEACASIARALQINPHYALAKVEHQRRCSPP